MRIQELLNKMPAGAMIRVFLNLKELYHGTFRFDEDYYKIVELSAMYTVKRSEVLPLRLPLTTRLSS